MEPISRVLRNPRAARALGLSESTLNKMRVRGDGPPFVRLGAKLVGYLQEDLDRWLESRRTLSTSAARPEAAER
jgi:predicted DNA-binding transcriptional regulator AlpA